ncbi:AAA family ATPase [Brachyspira pulli]|uniref:AAA family ATPase n=1 Tax=Brachyspira pulli TaxID=310721 RepID=UPI0030075061
MSENIKYPTLYVKNFAKIKEAKIELSPFTLFIGDNNSGKSYLASLIWYIQNIKLLYKFYTNIDYPKIESLDNISYDIINKNIINSKIDNNVINDIIKTINNILKTNKKNILADIFSSTQIEIEELYILDYEINYDISINILLYEKNYFDSDDKGKVKYYLTITFNINDNEYKKYENVEINNINDLSLFLLEKIYSILFNSSSQLFLPVSRTGFLLLRDLIIRKSPLTLWNNTYDVSNKVSLTLPVQDFFNQLSNVLERSSIAGFDYLKINNEFDNIYNFISSNILDGSIIIDQMINFIPISSYLTNYLRPQENVNIFYKSKNSNYNFDMHISSSVITEIAPLVLFLKYLKYTNIIMEEPEISLHPKLQQQLTRLFIKLINIGVNVMITTHSDTIIQHINNMIKLNNNKEDVKKELMKKYNYNEDDLISEDKVRMYQFDIKEDGFTEVTEIKGSKYGFQAPTFHKYLMQSSEEFEDFIEDLDN